MRAGSGVDALLRRWYQRGRHECQEQGSRKSMPPNLGRVSMSMYNSNRQGVTSIF